MAFSGSSKNCMCGPCVSLRTCMQALERSQNIHAVVFRSATLRACLDDSPPRLMIEADRILATNL